MRVHLVSNPGLRDVLGDYVEYDLGHVCGGIVRGTCQDGSPILRQQTPPKLIPVCLLKVVHTSFHRFRGRDLDTHLSEYTAVVVVMDSWCHFARHSGLKIRYHQIQEIRAASRGLDVLSKPMRAAHVLQFDALGRIVARETQPIFVVNVEIPHCEKRNRLLRIRLVFLLKPLY